MKNIEEILEQFGLKVPEGKETEFKKVLHENYKTIAEYDKKVSRLETERDGYKEKLETAETTLKGFEGVDMDAIKTELDTYKAKVKEQEDTYNKALYDRDFKDALNAAISDIKFSSEAAKKSVVSDIKAAGLKLIDGKIMGLNDFIAACKEKDASAFIDEAEESLKNSQAKFSSPMKTSSRKPTMSELMKMKNENPNLDISEFVTNKKE
ncbi:MAG: phage scaffolding protein [Clostridium sp.]|nr:phage scaffolding protein [Clostridium sp.]MCM1460642.1 phage scaffolding protein [Bacteroides sp.]